MSTRPAILLTGFAPFDGEAINPSWEAVRALRGRRIAGHVLRTVCLPVVFGDSLRVLDEALRRIRPNLVVCVGQAGGRSAVSLERVAINLDDARIPDNAGRQPIDTPVAADGPAAYFSTLPIKALRQSLLDAGIPADISQSAGTFVCNHVFYGLMHALRHYPGARGGFLHIPYLPEQAARNPGAPSMALDAVVEALGILIRCALETPVDVSLSGGALH